MAATLNFVGAMVSSKVAKTVGGSIANPAKIENGVEIVIAALLAAIIWNLLTWYLAIPSSSSHTLLGSLAGAVIAGAGIHAVNWSGFTQIIIILILSPIIAFADWPRRCGPRSGPAESARSSSRSRIFHPG